MSDIVVVDYDPQWPARFVELRARVWPAISDIARSIEHVGSTAVPGLAAKPVIDMDVVVPPSAVAEGIDRLASLGYEHRGDLGIPDREAFRAPPHLPRHHLYLCPEGSPALANHRAVRDYLRTHPADARAYGDLKKSLAIRFRDDMDGYVEAKTRFLVRILRSVGFPDASVDDVEQMNRRD